MAEHWLPEKDRTRVTQNGSTLSFMDHELFTAIGKLAHEVGELKRHDDKFAYELGVMGEKVEGLGASLSSTDGLQVLLAVEAYINLAATHPEGSRICTHDPHHELAALTESRLYQASGLAANLMQVCP